MMAAFDRRGRFEFRLLWEMRGNQAISAQYLFWGSLRPYVNLQATSSIAQKSQPSLTS